MIVIRTDRTVWGLARIRDHFRPAVELMIRRVTGDAAVDARGTSAFKDRSGRLRAAIKEAAAGLRGTVAATTGYAGYVENGTQPHRIAARNAQFLRFEQNGQIMFRKSVWHPGTAPRRFMEHASKAGEISMVFRADEAISRLIREL